jgi:Short-chain dehydrogenases of various substrate specificities
MSNNQKICLIAGCGPGTDTESVKKFSQEGYKVIMLARNMDLLNELQSKTKNTYAYKCDVSDMDQIKDVCAKVKNDIGDPNVFIHNAVAGVADGGLAGSFLSDNPERLDRNFKVNTKSLLYFARELAPSMIKNKYGSIIITGNTSALRGKPDFIYFAPTKAAQRIRAESLAREWGPKGVHVAYILIDGAMDRPRTRPILAADKKEDFFGKPKDMAAEIYHVAHQARCACLLV